MTPPSPSEPSPPPDVFESRRRQARRLVRRWRDFGVRCDEADGFTPAVRYAFTRILRRTVQDIENSSGQPDRNAFGSDLDLALVTLEDLARQILDQDPPVPRQLREEVRSLRASSRGLRLLSHNPGPGRLTPRKED